MTHLHPVAPDSQVKLTDHDPADTGDLSHAEAEGLLPTLSTALATLQEIQYAAATNAVLIVLQGLDTAGKDGTISHVMDSLNPLGCRVEAFKAPTPEELAHDFLWRVHKVTPPHGTITIFNRSHYEDVLAVRVHKLVPKEVWQKRYDQINAFESLLAESGTIILKFFLHISKKEQQQRLLSRLHEEDKAWKLSVNDWPEHALYDEYTGAYADLLSRCSTSYAPWYIVPADHKWARNALVAETLVEVLSRYGPGWNNELEQRGKKILEQIKPTLPPGVS